MTVTAHHSDSSWVFRWWRDPSTQVELEWVAGRERWLRCVRIDGAGWGPAQQVALRSPADEDDAREIAEGHAAG